MKLIFLVFSISLFGLSSCSSYRLPKKQEPKSKRFLDDSPTAFVVNKCEQKKAFKVLKDSYLYTLTNDSTASIQIELQPIRKQKWLMCYTGVFPAFVITLGQVPLRWEEQYVLANTVEQNGISIEKIHNVPIDKRLWFWDLFAYRKRPHQIMGKAIRQGFATERDSYLKQ